MKKTLGSILAGLALSGCIATTEGYSQMVNAWVGAPESSLIAQAGPPNRAYASGGLTYLTYESSRVAYMPPIAPTYQTTVIGNTAYTNAYGGSPGYSIPMSCQTTFVVQRQIIRSVSFKGNDCRAVPPTE
jgi:hypothetical protein